MTDPVLRTTYEHEVDGESYDCTASIVRGLMTHQPRQGELVEKEWRLVRFRTIRLGADEPCEQCDGAGDEVFFDPQNLYYSEPCKPCNGTGVKTRDIDPPWTEAKTEPCKFCDGKGNCKCCGLPSCAHCLYDANGRIIKETPSPVDWKAIATQLPQPPLDEEQQYEEPSFPDLAISEQEKK